MAHRLKPTQSNKTGQVLYWTSIIATILGTADATYLLIYKYTNNNAMCLGNGGCHNVNISPYSEVYGIPVALLGILAYLAILGLHFLEPRLKLFTENGPLLVFGFSLVGVAFSAYLTYLELYVIHAVCPFCVFSAVIITIIFIVAIIRLVKQTVS